MDNHDRASALWRAGTVVIFGFLYGANMGTFGGVGGDRPWQILFSAIKVPLLFGATFLLSLPSYFVLNTLMGLRNDFREVLLALTQTQAGLAMVLCSLAPLVNLWYASFADYPTAVLFHALLFTVASLAAQVILRRGYGPLIKRNPRHRPLLVLWLVIYAFVGIQMGWVLRPFVGDPTLPARFLREDVWQENAYVVVLRSIGHALGTFGSD